MAVEQAGEPAGRLAAHRERQPHVRRLRHRQLQPGAAGERRRPAPRAHDHPRRSVAVTPPARSSTDAVAGRADREHLVEHQRVVERAGERVDRRPHADHAAVLVEHDRAGPGPSSAEQRQPLRRPRRRPPRAPGRPAACIAARRERGGRPERHHPVVPEQLAAELVLPLAPDRPRLAGEPPRGARRRGRGGRSATRRRTARCRAGRARRPSPRAPRSRSAYAVESPTMPAPTTATPPLTGRPACGARPTTRGSPARGRPPAASGSGGRRARPSRPPAPAPPHAPRSPAPRTPPTRPPPPGVASPSAARRPTVRTPYSRAKARQLRDPVALHAAPGRRADDRRRHGVEVLPPLVVEPVVVRAQERADRGRDRAGAVAERLVREHRRELHDTHPGMARRVAAAGETDGLVRYGGHAHVLPDAPPMSTPPVAPHGRRFLVGGQGAGVGSRAAAPRAARLGRPRRSWTRSRRRGSSSSAGRSAR